MKYDIADALQSLKPGSQWVLRGREYSGLEWMDSGQQPTKQEIADKIAELDAAEPMRLLRIERNKKIAETDWRASSDLTLSDDWKTYRQALRDLPANCFPRLDKNYELDYNSLIWPIEPS